MDEKRKDKHKPSSAYQVERQGSHGIVYSNLNKSDPWIYQNGKIMFHRNLTYGDVCDSDHDNICAEVKAEGAFRGKRQAIREIVRQLCQWKGVEMIEGGDLQIPYTCCARDITLAA